VCRKAPGFRPAPRTPGVRSRYEAGYLKRFHAVPGENGLKLSWEKKNVRLWRWDLVVKDFTHRTDEGRT
jgi:hypothetical protein